MSLAYKREDLIGRYERWKLRVGCNNTTYLFGKPELTVRALDGLFWAEWILRCEFYEPDRDAPIRRIPKRIVSEIESGMEYIKHLSEWFFTTNALACEYGHKPGAMYKYNPAMMCVPKSNSPYFTFPWVEEEKIKAGNRTRRPALTRKRANGLWWMLVVWDLLKEDAQEHDLGWLCVLDTEQEDMSDIGVQFISQLANWHETQHPTAERKR
jgi:hypothetical protein